MTFLPTPIVSAVDLPPWISPACPPIGTASHPLLDMPRSPGLPSLATGSQSPQSPSHSGSSTSSAHMCFDSCRPSLSSSQHKHPRCATRAREQRLSKSFYHTSRPAGEGYLPIPYSTTLPRGTADFHLTHLRPALSSSVSPCLANVYTAY